MMTMIECFVAHASTHNEEPFTDMELIVMKTYLSNLKLKIKLTY
jgi:hypothetical protein